MKTNGQDEYFCRYWPWSRRLQNIMWWQRRNISLRRLQDVFKKNIIYGSVIQISQVLIVLAFFIHTSMKVFTGFTNVSVLLHLFILGHIFGFVKSNKYFRIFSKLIQYLSFSRYLPIFIWQNILAITNNIFLHYIC